MRISRFLMLVFTVVLSVGLCSCSKDDDDNNATSTTTGGGGLGQSSDDWVDLGLPSGLLWATHNVGADSPEEYGDYFAWGETQPKEEYFSYTYAYYISGSLVSITKYCVDPRAGYNGVADYLTTLWPSDDAATVNWGGGARTPILAEWEELIANTDTAWTTRNGVNGVLFTAANGNSLFLPAAGCMEDGPLDTGAICLYWSSSLFTDNLAYSTDSDYAWGFCSDYPGMNHCARSFGLTVRAVFSAR